MLKKINIFTVLTFLIFGFIFFHLGKEMLQVRDDGYYVGQVNLYGDLVFHLGFINKFLQTNQVLVTSPIYASNKPEYPLFADFVTAQVAKLTGVYFALFITTFLMGLVTIYLARFFIRKFQKNERIVFVSLLLFFINGGLGFIYFFTDFLNSNQSIFAFLSSMPHEYTDLKDKGYWFINTILAYFLPQRTFLFAFPVTLLILILLYTGVKTANRSRFLLAGILSGFLPLIQPHSLFVIFILSLFYFPISLYLTKDKKQEYINWFIFAIATTLIALPMFNVVSDTSNALKFIKISPGWTSQENIFIFWFKNLGLFGPTLIVASIWLYFKDKMLLLLYFPFLFIFIISNIFIFQPWNFDNSKLLVYWFFASTIVVSYFLEEIFFNGNKAKVIIGCFLVLVMTFASILDIYRTFTPVTNYKIFSQSDITVASQVEKLTPVDSLFITASNHNHVIPALAGRTTLLGFHGWVWSHGLPFEQRAADITRIYLGGKNAEDLISKYKINYVTIGPHEKSEFSINESYFKKYPKIYLGNDWFLYDVSNLWANGNRQNSISN